MPAIVERMDDQRVGAAFRAIRIRLGLTKDEVGIASRTSRHIVGRVERGRLDRVPMANLRAVGHALDLNVDLVIRWRGGDLGRLVNARHSALHEAVAARLADLTGWSIEPEVSYSIAANVASSTFLPGMRRRRRSWSWSSRPRSST